uniref:ATP-citrate synthase n=3 Tax=Ciona intestinalis TaxID=7719 RepID=Q9NDQ3_CIOIN|nr:ATP citrate-lyase [Ciona intestinalis]BAB00624.1 ATP citrate-lyase [Ciona intestinalis]|eukprot:NP_001027756.1 ATP citrate-lyase [Ciona intestinalis]
MSAKAINEITAKTILCKNIGDDINLSNRLRFASVDRCINWDELAVKHPWLLTEKLIVKPDQLIKRRGKLGLIKINTDYAGVQQWVGERMLKEISIGETKGILKHFIIEPFVAHKQEEEFYICIHSSREEDTILFHHEGGVNIGDVDAKANKLHILTGEKADSTKITTALLKSVSRENQRLLEPFILSLYEFYTSLHFTYLEINPLVVNDGKIYVLDLAAKLDQCAEFVCARTWGPVEFPPPFGREAYPEEAYIADLDAKSGASLKLTILNPNGRIWTMVAGGGASVVYSDTICDLGGASELANYGEYSGAPSEQQTYDYARTILSLMTRTPRDDGKVLIIGGGIANFTNVAATFKGIVRALKQFQASLRSNKVSIFVRRGGPNYQEGLRVMREVGQHLGVPVHVFGTETHMTAIVGMALGKTPIPDQQPNDPGHTANFLLGASSNYAGGTPRTSRTSSFADNPQANGDAAQALNGTSVLQEAAKRAAHRPMFTNKTRCIIWGLQSRAVQGMMDFDFVCSRKTPSVAAMVYPFSGDHKQKFYWGHKEILIPVYKNMSDAMHKHSDADVMISFASLRSAEESTIDTLQYQQIRTIAIIAEGIPEATTKKLNKLAREKNVSIIGPATVGGIKPGCFKIGNTGGMMDNILASKLYRPGSVAYVSRSGGMSNELNNIISRTTNGVCEGVAIGGDRYPGTTFMDHILRYQNDANVKMIVVLGEVGGTEEYDICDAIKSATITKPVIAWCIGTCATMFASEVQFGHAGACANQASETAAAKNKALAAAGAHVPCSFNELNTKIREVYNNLVDLGVVVVQEDVPPPTVPMDYSWARELGLIRKPASFMSSISDERGQELLYAGMPISQVFKDDLGIGGVLGLLWVQKRLPTYACKVFRTLVDDDSKIMDLQYQGAHNTIVCARAGKDLISCLTSGLLTIGDRFGGALDGAARQFSAAYDKGLLPSEFVNEMRKKHQLIMGIGHRVKSLNNPDQRVVILKEFVKSNFPSTPLLDYALEVEKVTTAKKPNLILNVDGFIGVTFVDLLRGCGCFTEEEAREYVQIGALNGVFVLGRSMGFIGHYLDQLRLKQGLYRHPWDDISYVLPEDYSS